MKEKKNVSKISSARVIQLTRLKLVRLRKRVVSYPIELINLFTYRLVGLFE